MATIVIEDRDRTDSKPLAKIVNQMTGTLHAKVEPGPYVPGWITLHVVAPRDRVEIACELWLSAHYENWRVEN